MTNLTQGSAFTEAQATSHADTDFGLSDRQLAELSQTCALLDGSGGSPLEDTPPFDQASYSPEQIEQIRRVRTKVDALIRLTRPNADDESDGILMRQLSREAAGDEEPSDETTDKDFGLSDEQLEEIMGEYCWTGRRQSRTMTLASDGRTEVSGVDTEFGLSDEQLDGLTRACEQMDDGTVHVATFSVQQLEQIRRVRNKMRALLRLTGGTSSSHSGGPPVLTRQLSSSSPNAAGAEEPEDEDYGLSDQQLENVMNEYCWSGGRKTRTMTQASDGTAVSGADSEFGLSAEQLGDLTHACDVLDGSGEEAAARLPCYSVPQLEQIRRVRNKMRALLRLTKVSEREEEEDDPLLDAPRSSSSPMGKAGDRGRGRFDWLCNRRQSAASTAGPKSVEPVEEYGLSDETLVDIMQEFCWDSSRRNSRTRARTSTQGTQLTSAMSLPDSAFGLSEQQLEGLTNACRLLDGDPDAETGETPLPTYSPEQLDQIQRAHTTATALRKLSRSTVGDSSHPDGGEGLLVRQMSKNTGGPSHADEEFGLADEQLEDIMNEYCWSGRKQARKITSVSDVTGVSAGDSEYGLSADQLDGLTRACRLLDGDATAEMEETPLPTYTDKQLGQVRRVYDKVKSLTRITGAERSRATSRASSVRFASEHDSISASGGEACSRRASDFSAASHKDDAVSKGVINSRITSKKSTLASDYSFSHSISEEGDGDTGAQSSGMDDRERRRSVLSNRQLDQIKRVYGRLSSQSGDSGAGSLEEGSISEEQLEQIVRAYGRVSKKQAEGRTSSPSTSSSASDPKRTQHRVVGTSRTIDSKIHSRRSTLDHLDEISRQRRISSSQLPGAADGSMIPGGDDADNLSTPRDLGLSDEQLEDVIKASTGTAAASAPDTQYGLSDRQMNRLATACKRLEGAAEDNSPPDSSPLFSTEQLEQIRNVYAKVKELNRLTRPSRASAHSSISKHSTVRFSSKDSIVDSRRGSKFEPEANFGLRDDELERVMRKKLSRRASMMTNGSGFSADDSEFGLADHQFHSRKERHQSQLTQGTQVSGADSDYGLSDMQLRRLSCACDLLEGEALPEGTVLPAYTEQQFEQISRVYARVKTSDALTNVPTEQEKNFTRRMSSSSVLPGLSSDAPDDDFGLSEEQIAEIMNDYCWTGRRKSRKMTGGSVATEVSGVDTDFGLSDEQLNGLNLACQVLEGSAGVEKEDDVLSYPKYSTKQLGQIRRAYNKVKAFNMLTKGGAADALETRRLSSAGADDARSEARSARSATEAVSEWWDDDAGSEWYSRRPSTVLPEDIESRRPSTVLPEDILSRRASTVLPMDIDSDV
jgi:hypothetical protein